MCHFQAEDGSMLALFGELEMRDWEVESRVRSAACFAFHLLVRHSISDIGQAWRRHRSTEKCGGENTEIYFLPQRPRRPPAPRSTASPYLRRLINVFRDSGEEVA